MPVEAEVPRRGGEADEHAAVSSGASAAARRIPTTVNQRPPSQILDCWPTRSMPSRCAAEAPSTATGRRAVAAFRNRPRASDVPTAVGSPTLAASTWSAFVSTAGIFGLR